MNEDGFHHFICGKLLGDGCITKQAGRKPRFQFMHRIEDAAWVQNGYEQLKSNIPLNPPTYRKVADARLKKGYSESYIVQSRTDDAITALYELWYPDGKKKLPIDWIEQYLDERALAWWYQDDGHLKIANGIASKIILSTDSFAPAENEWLTQTIENKWKLRFQQDGQNRLILYDQFQIMYFLHLVSPWLHDSMARKTIREQPLKPIAKRTTIYLPSSYEIARPTKEINEKLSKLNTLFLDMETKSICRESIFHLFYPLLNQTTSMKSYQIIIHDDHKTALQRIRQLTGLTVSQLVGYCFM
ncbi:hypothetical protein [Bacillus sp. OxB-1]|uniref:hypothetical protein n=1 Tax=Bacillus sp. (strain OxB-1) TaxID=98228 RepID=UPI00069643A3|nr:hypothetical protein [Bacillus sp. OxB-1]